jgi:hypothetical protein
MGQRTWTLLNEEDHLRCEDDFEITARDVEDPGADYRIMSRVGRGGLSEGVQIVAIDNGALRFDVLPTRGMGLWKAWYHGDSVEEHIGWTSPVRGPVHPGFVPLAESTGLGWLDGFDELLVRCGLESNGAPDFDDQGRLLFPLHGRIANRPAHRVDVLIDTGEREIAVLGVVEETRFHFAKLRMESVIRTRIGSTTIDVRDEVINLSAQPVQIQMLYHVNFGRPLLDAGARVVTPADRVVPRDAHAAAAIDTWDGYAAAEAGFKEQVYFLKLHANTDGQTQVLLKNRTGSRGAGLRFNTRQLPCFSLWKNTAADEDGYVTGLEPGTNFPNPRSFERQQGRVVSLPGGGSTSFELSLEYHPTPEAVERAAQEVGALAAGPPRVF